MEKEKFSGKSLTEGEFLGFHPSLKGKIMTVTQHKSELISPEREVYFGKTVKQYSSLKDIHETQIDKVKHQEIVNSLKEYNEKTTIGFRNQIKELEEKSIDKAKVKEAIDNILKEKRPEGMSEGLFMPPNVFIDELEKELGLKEVDINDAD